MKVKTLKKKIRLLEARLQKGSKKLAKFKRKLDAAAGAAKAKKKSAGPAGKKTGTLRPISKSGAAPAKKSRRSAKVKRKLNLSPERRAELAAAMRARWAAKRAAASSANQDFSIGQAPETPPSL